MDKNDSRFRREIAYREFMKTQDRSWDISVSRKSSEDPVEDISWLENCKIKPLFGFEEVYGLDTVKEKFYAHYLNNGKLRIRRRSNMLLYGEPGCGKTHVIKAVAKVVSPVPVYNIKIGQILSKYYGESSKIISQMFSDLSSSESILFIDEIDAIGSSRDGGSEAHNRALNTFLSEIDGIESNGKVMLIGATNRIDNVDKALLDRFENRIYVDKPSYNARIKMFENEVLKNIDGEVDVDYSKVASMVGDDYSGREIRSLVVKAYEVASGSKKDKIEMIDFEKAYQEIRKPI